MVISASLVASYYSIGPPDPAEAPDVVRRPTKVATAGRGMRLSS
jgi:hypothetical protein